MAWNFHHSNGETSCNVACGGNFRLSQRWFVSKLRPAFGWLGSLLGFNKDDAGNIEASSPNGTFFTFGAGSASSVP